MNIERGLITFEGIEGCGKTTQMRKLKDTLLSLGWVVVTTFEPGEGPIGTHIRNTLLSHHPEPLNPMAELMLYLADRAQHVQYFLEPALKKKKLILCDRYIDSTLAYQGYGRGLSLDLINDLNNLVTRELTPSLTFLLDCPPKIGLNRIHSKRDRMESQTLMFHEKVRRGYLTLAKHSPERIVVIDATRPIPTVFERIIDTLKKREFIK